MERGHVARTRKQTLGSASGPQLTDSKTTPLLLSKPKELNPANNPREAGSKDLSLQMKRYLANTSISEKCVFERKDKMNFMSACVCIHL